MRKNIVIISALALLLVGSVVMNVYQFAAPFDSWGTDKPSDISTTPEADSKLTLVELEMVNIAINHFIVPMKRDFPPEKVFMTKSSYQQLYDLVNDYSTSYVDRENGTIVIEYANLTEEKIKTFQLVFSDADYFVFVDMGSIDPNPSGSGVMGTEPSK